MILTSNKSRCDECGTELPNFELAEFDCNNTYLQICDRCLQDALEVIKKAQEELKPKAIPLSEEQAEVMLAQLSEYYKQDLANLLEIMKGLEELRKSVKSS